MSLDPKKIDLNKTKENAKKSKRKYFVNVKNPDSQFFKACAEGNLQVVKQFVKEGFYLKKIIQAKEIFGENDAFYYNQWFNGFDLACLEGNLNIVQFLLKIGFVLKKPKLTLHYATQSQNITLIKYLFADLGYDQQFSEKDFIRLLLSVSCKLGDKKITTFYLQFVNINARDRTGKTCMHYACESKSDNLDFVKWLIKTGCDIKIKDSRGRTGLEYACEQGNLKIVKFLIDQTSSHGKECFQLACKNGNLNLVKFLFKRWSPQQLDIKIAFHVACHEKNKLNVVKFLVERRGANLDYVRHQNRTALNIASLQGNLNIVQYLVQKGCDLNLRNEYYGKTTLQVLFGRMFHSSQHIAYGLCILTLIEAGANFDHNEVPAKAIFLIQNRIVEITFTKNQIFENFPDIIAEIIINFTMLPT
jgi:ankyrin repeat protein